MLTFGINEGSSLKTTLSEWKTHKSCLTNNAASSDTRLADVMAIKNATLKER